MIDYQSIIDQYYPAGKPLRDIYMRHCRQVSDLALSIASERNLPLDPADIEAAAMLHDIGIFLTDAPGIHCHGTAPYIAHGHLGADLLRRHGVPELIAAVAEHHTGAGLTAADIEANNLPLPLGDYMPRTLLEQLICYADKFYSKSGDMQRKPLERVRSTMAKWGPDTAARFEQLHTLFTA